MRKKVASRFLLPNEMLSGLVSIAVGLSGKLSGSVLYRMLHEGGAAGWWLAGFCLVGAAQAIIAASEWHYGRRWPLATVFRVVTLRLVASFLAATSWLVASMYLFVVCDVVISLTFICPVFFAFAVWSYVENYRVKDALDENVSTETIIFDR